MQPGAIRSHPSGQSWCCLRQQEEEEEGAGGSLGKVPSFSGLLTPPGPQALAEISFKGQVCFYRLYPALGYSGKSLKRLLPFQPFQDGKAPGAQDRPPALLPELSQQGAATGRLQPPAPAPRDPSALNAQPSRPHPAPRKALPKAGSNEALGAQAGTAMGTSPGTQSSRLRAAAGALPAAGTSLTRESSFPVAIAIADSRHPVVEKVQQLPQGPCVGSQRGAGL